MPSQKVSKKAVSKTQKTAAKKATTQKAGGKTTKVAKTTAPKVTKSAATKASKATQKAGGKKATPAKKTAPTKKAPPAKKVVQKAGGEKGEKKEKSIRSFKVQLPGKEEYTGRFTGWTPYQAANKALSRYFRSTEDPKPVVTFSIRESTRGSNHKVYTYEGHRVKLETPVSYTIGEGNTIVKHHKNQLKKVKKADLAKKENL